MSENHVNRPPNILDRDFVRLGFIILIMASYALRLHELTRQDIWWDEARNIDVALRPFGQVATAPELDIHPPVYFWLLHGWLRLMRVAHGMEPALIAFAARYASVWAGVAGVGLLFALAAGASNRRAGLLAAAVGALSPFWLAESQEKAHVYARLCAPDGGRASALPQHRRRMSADPVLGLRYAADGLFWLRLLCCLRWRC